MPVISNAPTLSALASFDASIYSTYYSLYADAAGNLFGASANATDGRFGILFELVKAASVVTNLATFDGANGSHLAGPLIADAAGNLYGTTLAGGSGGKGTVFKLAKGAASVTTLASFPANELSGSGPSGALVVDAVGNLFGVASAGGMDGLGVVFEVVAGASTITPLASLNDVNGPRFPESGLVQDAAGNLFGITGGSAGGHDFDEIFELAKGASSIEVLATFDDASRVNPSTLAMDSAGNLFGTTYDRGDAHRGTVFELVKNAATITTLANVGDTTIGVSAPNGGVVVDAAGNLFGTTGGGTTGGAGTVFELAKGASTITVIASFAIDSNSGFAPEAGLAVDAAGNLFGTTMAGGASGLGAVFEVSNSGFVVPSIWTGGALDGQWSTAGNWSTGKVPDAAAVVQISGTATSTISLSGNVQAWSIDISDANADLLVKGATTLTLGSNLVVQNGATLEEAAGYGGSAWNSPTIVAPGGVTIETGGRLSGFDATIAGNVVNSVTASSAGGVGINAAGLSILGSLTGAGTSFAHSGSDFALSATGAVSQAITLSSAGGATLRLSDPASVTGGIQVVAGVAAGSGQPFGAAVPYADTIDFTGLAAGAAATGSYDGSVLTVVADGKTYSLNVSRSSATSSWSSVPVFSSDGAGGTDVSLIVGRTDIWTGAVSTDWTSDGNWSLGFAPGTYDTAVIPASAPRSPSIVAAVQAQAWNVSMPVAGATVNVAGTLTVGSASQSLNGGTLAVAGGTVTGLGGLHLAGGMITLADGALTSTFDIAVGQDVTVTHATAHLGLASIGANNFFTNNGSINVGVSGGTISINVGLLYNQSGFSDVESFINNGAILVSNHDTLTAQLGGAFATVNNYTNYYIVPKFNNSGTISVTNGASASFGGANWTNTGSITVGSGATLSLYGNYSSLSGITNHGTLILDGSTSANLGPVEVSSGLLVINPSYQVFAVPGFLSSGVGYIGPITGAALTIDQGATLELQGYAASASPNMVDQNTQGTIRFAAPGATLELDGLNAFAGTLLGLAAGDVIDFINTDISSASFGASGLTVTASDGTSATYSTGSSVLGSKQLTLKSDGNGGTALTVAPAEIVTVAANKAILARANTQYQGGGNDQFYVTPITIADTIDGGGNNSSLGVLNGGTSVMGDNITGFGQVHLMAGVAGTTGFTFTANATPGLTVVGSLGDDVITVGDASQTIFALGLHSVIKATAATAGARVAGIHGDPILEITGGGSATLNGNDGHGLIVQIDQAMILDMGATSFISAVAETAGSTVTAGAPFQTLVTLAGGTTFIGATARNTYQDTLKGTAAGLDRDVFVNFGKSDAIDITDVLPASSIIYTQNTATYGTLAFGGSSVSLQGVFDPTKFHAVSDGLAGTLVKYLG